MDASHVPYIVLKNKIGKPCFLATYFSCFLALNIREKRTLIRRGVLQSIDSNKIFNGFFALPLQKTVFQKWCSRVAFKKIITKDIERNCISIYNHVFFFFCTCFSHYTLKTCIHFHKSNIQSFIFFFSRVMQYTIYSDLSEWYSMFN